MSIDLPQFLKNYEITVLNTARKPKLSRCPKNFTIQADNGIGFDESDHKTELNLTITIPESKLVRLAEIDHMFFDGRLESDYRDMFAAIMDQKRDKEYYCKNYEAVNAAYEQFLTLLNLVKNSNNNRP